MRVFLDANILFSAAKSDGAIRQLLRNLKFKQHTLVADSYVQAEAMRNITAKSDSQAVSDLQALIGTLEVAAVQFARVSVALEAAALWLPEKDRPVLLAAMVLKCDVLVTGDSTHFGDGYGKVFEGVAICSPRQLLELI